MEVVVLTKNEKVQGRFVIFRSLAGLKKLLVLLKMEPTVGLGLAAAAGGTFGLYKVPLIGNIGVYYNLIDWYL